MKRNAYFQLIHEDNGLFLQSFPAQDGGAPLSAEDVLQYLDLKKYSDNVNPVEIGKFVETAKAETARLRVSGKSDCLPETETAVITVDKYSTMAKVRLYPPSSKGKQLTEADLLSLIEQQGVKHGLMNKNISLLLKAKLYCTDVLIAKATLPVQGSDAEITYHFDVDKTSKPAVNEDGSVDFHKLDMIERVKEGQLLATLKPEVQGTPGMDVRGMPIAPKKVKRLILKHGKKIHLSEDNLEMYSEVSGNVTLVSGTVFVSNVYEVPADVGPSTGDIDYDGSVEVKGNVLAGYTVKASGDITVNGAVESATLEAGGKIVLKRGIQGMGKGVMKAEGDVISNFIESSEVSSGGRVITDAIMHSHVEAKDEIKVDGKRGMIAGGSVRSTLKIFTKVAGSTMGTQTELEVGTDPTLADRYQRIEKEIDKLGTERDSLLQNIDILKKRLKSKGTLSEDKLVLLKSSVMRVQEIGENIESLTEEYEEVEAELEANKGGGKIIIYDIAYPGVKLTISNISSFIHNETHHSAFVREGADIRVKGI
ncbi:MAG: DUF342 domain-containing protein [Lachnospiraceae bacterium]|nr:DUF342 domain-containing protein [Lachnospiraceae bacterium]